VQGQTKIGDTSSAARPARGKVARSRFIFLIGEPRAIGRLDHPDDRHVPSLTAWQILTANNRVVGRSAQLYPDLEACFEAALQMHLSADRAISTICSLPETNRWTWTVRVDEGIVAYPAHEYQRRVECVRGVGQFLTVAEGTLPKIDDVRHVGPNPFFGSTVAR
jgi:hypothetical protein